MTYSLALTGTLAEQTFGVATVTLDDAAAAAPANTMQEGTVFLGKGPDGSQALYQYDAERSIPGVSRVLKRVYPPA